MEDDDLTLRRENLFRASMPAGVELRADDTAAPVLTGRFAVFNQWTTIDSRYEGHFLERVAPGAFKKTFTENRDKIRVLLNHGRDGVVGDKPIAKITDLREDDNGAYYEADLFDGVPPLVLDGLRAGQYGASFKFSVERQNVVKEPERSAYNPDGIPERTIQEARVFEFGPVTFPAYEGATAGVRSLTDVIHDVDAMTLASPVLLDEDRLERATIFVRASLAPPAAAEAADVPDEPEAAEEARDTPDTPSEPAPAAPIYGMMPGDIPAKPIYGLRGEDQPSWRLG